MSKTAVSVTLGVENLTWLKGRVGAGSAKSVSDLLDRLITDARARGSLGPARSVVGTIDLPADDQALDDADAVVRRLFDDSLRRSVTSRMSGTRRRARRG